MAKLKDAVGKPVGDRSMELIKFAGKEMIDPFDDHETILTGERGDERFDFFDGAVLVVACMHEQFWFFALAKK